MDLWIEYYPYPMVFWYNNILLGLINHPTKIMMDTERSISFGIKKHSLQVAWNPVSPCMDPYLQDKDAVIFREARRSIPRDSRNLHKEAKIKRSPQETIEDKFLYCNCYMLL